MTTRITQLTVLPENEPLFSELSTIITIEDEAGGEFVIVSQNGNGLGKIQIDPREWPALRAAINRLVKQCQPEHE